MPSASYDLCAGNLLVGTAVVNVATSLGTSVLTAF